MQLLIIIIWMELLTEIINWNYLNCWFRGYLGEDPFLTSQMIRELIHGLQNVSDPTYIKVAFPFLLISPFLFFIHEEMNFLTWNQSQKQKLLATCKHYAAYSLEEWEGIQRHEFEAQVSPTDLDQTYFPAFEVILFFLTSDKKSFSKLITFRHVFNQELEVLCVLITQVSFHPII